jgi:hypothetical protein
MNVYPTSISRPTAIPPRRICSGGGGSGSGADAEELKSYVDSAVASVRGDLHESIRTLEGYLSDQLKGYLTKSDADGTYAKASALAGYLTKSDAEATYATLGKLADYLTKTDAEATYATLGKLAEYLTKSYADGAYAKASALSGYLTKTEASSTYATLGKLAEYLTKSDASALRDKADNIATKDEMQFTEWKFHCNMPEIQAALDANPPVMPCYDDHWRLEGLPDVEGYYPGSARSNESYNADATAVSFREGYLSDGGGAFLVSATRTKIFTTKEGEPYVTPTGVKAITAPEFNKLTPEVIDTTVTLKPVDGAANYVTEKAEVNGLPKVKRDIRGTVCLDFGSPVNGDLGLICYATFDTSSCGGVELRVYSEDGEDGGGAGYASFTVSQNIPLKVDDVSVESEEWETEGYPVPSKGDVIGYIGPDTKIEMYLSEEDLQTVPSTIDVSEVALFDPVIDDPFYQIAFIELYFSDGCKLIALAEGGSGRDVTVAIPSTTGNVRKFSLTVETDAEEEKDVTWSGCTVIEAFPGASKLVPGTVVWDVKEVAPGKMLVNRAPGAAGGAVTVTGDDGKAYTLAVDSEGTLEVRA